MVRRQFVRHGVRLSSGEVRAEFVRRWLHFRLQVVRLRRVPWSWSDLAFEQVEANRSGVWLLVLEAFEPTSPALGGAASHAPAAAPRPHRGKSGARAAAARRARAKNGFDEFLAYLTDAATRRGAS